MNKFIRRAGAAAALAAAVAIIAAVVMVSTQPAEAQAQPRVLLQGFGSASSIGVSIRDVTSEDATKAKMAQPIGAYVESVLEGTPASRAGIQAGDIVIDFDSERVRSASHFTRLVQESAPNREVSAVVVRGTGRQTVKIVPEGGNFNRLLSGNTRRQLQDLERQVPRNFNFDADALRKSFPAIGGAGLGATVSPLTEQLAGYFGVTRGVLVNNVTVNSPAAEAGLKAGDVITAINGQEVSNSADITRAMRGARDGGALDLTITRDRKSMSLKATVPSRTRPPSGRGGLPI